MLETRGSKKHENQVRTRLEFWFGETDVCGEMFGTTLSRIEN